VKFISNKRVKQEKKCLRYKKNSAGKDVDNYFKQKKFNVQFNKYPLIYLILKFILIIQHK
jgi:hypothetical protein